jgi:hypothetical protein
MTFRKPFQVKSYQTEKEDSNLAIRMYRLIRNSEARVLANSVAGGMPLGSPV